MADEFARVTRSRWRSRINIPEDVIDVILSRLPVKSLVRFRCVCKRWNERIRSPDFIEIHFKANSDHGDATRRGSIFLAKSDGAFFSVRVNEATTNLRLRVAEFEEGVGIVGSCNGLVCLLGRQSHALPRDYALWNPATRELRFLPVPEANLVSERHPIYSQGSGFLFDPESKDYKVVRIRIRFVQSRDVNDNRKHIAQVDVFTVSSNSWRSSQLHLPAEIDRISSFRPIFANGCCFWLVDILAGEESNRRVLCYSIGEENFRELIQMPCGLDGFQTSLHVSRDSLVMFSHTHTANYPRRESQFDLWVMNEDGDGNGNGGAHCYWSKELSVGPLEMVAVPYGFWMEDGVELVLLYILNKTSGRLHLFTFHPFTRKIKKFRGHYLQWCTYFESLVRV